MIKSSVICRSASVSSNSSSQTIITSCSLPSSRRTRKKFTREQLILLEETFRKSSHPNRETREELIKLTGLDLKSITIWFQNKRQTGRKSALYNSTNHSLPNVSISHLTSESLRTRTISDTHATWTIQTQDMQQNIYNNRLTLDRIASLTELPNHIPRTPRNLKRTETAPGALWDNMLSSPLRQDSPSASPKARSRDFVDFVKTQPTKKTLEWACASALLTQKAEELEASLDAVRDIHIWKGDDSDVEMRCSTEDDDHEAITPEASLLETPWIIDNLGSLHRKGGGRTLENHVKRKSLDEDVMTAAWALCGLKGI